MTQDRSGGSGHAPDAADVVDGPVGEAWLKDPATSGPIGADLEALPSIDAPPSPEAGRSIDGLPGELDVRHGST
jgi:hypothetical protein